MQAMPSSRSDHIALEDLELFAVVAEELHIGRAAARLHISQPGLSNRIQRRESGELVTVRVGFVGTALYSTLPALLRLTRVRHPDLRLLLERHRTPRVAPGWRLAAPPL